MVRLRYKDGTPVQVGDIVMSADGPKLVDGIEYDDGGWRLWAEFSRGQGKMRRRYIIDEGHFGVDEYGIATYPVLADDPNVLDEFDNQWWLGDEIVPNDVFVMVPSWLANVMDGMSYFDMTPDELVQAITREMNREDEEWRTTHWAG